MREDTDGVKKIKTSIILLGVLICIVLLIPFIDSDYKGEGPKEESSEMTDFETIKEFWKGHVERTEKKEVMYVKKWDIVNEPVDVTKLTLGHKGVVLSFNDGTSKLFSIDAVKSLKIKQDGVGRSRLVVEQVDYGTTGVSRVRDATLYLDADNYSKFNESYVMEFGNY